MLPDGRSDAAPNVAEQTASNAGEPTAAPNAAEPTAAPNAAEPIAAPNAAEPAGVPAPETPQESVAATQPAVKAHLDFVTAIVLAIICIAAIIASYGYYKASGNLFYESPGMMPTLVASGTLICAFILFIGSIKGSSIGQRVQELAASVPVALRSSRFWNSVAAVLIFGVYVFLLLRVFPFWLASFIMLCFTFFYTNAASVIKILLISALSVAGIVLLFQVAFSVPLP